jgi:hypothetical protein
MRERLPAAECEWRLADGSVSPSHDADPAHLDGFAPRMAGHSAGQVPAVRAADRNGLDKEILKRSVVRLPGVAASGLINLAVPRPPCFQWCVVVVTRDRQLRLISLNGGRPYLSRHDWMVGGNGRAPGRFMEQPQVQRAVRGGPHQGRQPALHLHGVTRVVAQSFEVRMRSLLDLSGDEWAFIAKETGKPTFFDAQ